MTPKITHSSFSLDHFVKVFRRHCNKSYYEILQHPPHRIVSSYRLSEQLDYAKNNKDMDSFYSFCKPAAYLFHTVSQILPPMPTPPQRRKVCWGHWLSLDGFNHCSATPSSVKILRSGTDLRGGAWKKETSSHSQGPLQLWGKQGLIQVGGRIREPELKNPTN